VTAPPPKPRRQAFKPIDWILLALATAALCWFVWRVMHLNNYRWNWAPIPQFFLRWDEATQSWASNILMHGLFNTVRLTIFGMILATLAGFGIGLMRTARDPFLRLVARSYVDLAQEALCQGKLRCAAEVRIACLRAADFRPAPMPDGLRRQIFLKQ
jgi:ABC-type phosphate/phosphonate transport system permease subunit